MVAVTDTGRTSSDMNAHASHCFPEPLDHLYVNILETLIVIAWD